VIVAISDPYFLFRREEALIKTALAEASLQTGSSTFNGTTAYDKLRTGVGAALCIGRSQLS
jgi:hypothetical protein